MPADRVRAGVPAELEDALDLGRRVVDPGHQRGDQHSSPIPAPFSSRIASIRFIGFGLPGSVSRQTFLSMVGIEKLAANSVFSLS